MGLIPEILLGRRAKKAAELPEPSKPLPMPDPLEQEAARKKALTDQLGRRGRAASVLTTPSDGDKLGG